MSDVHVCDVVLQARSRSVDARTVAKVHRRLGDMAAVAPKLNCLLLGELTWSLVPIGKDLVLRLGLVPIRQGWLFDPLLPGSTRPANLDAEALQVFEELSAARVRVARLAQVLTTGQANALGAPATRDPLAEVLLRQSRRQWHISRGREVVQVEFPDIPSFDVDREVTLIHGTLVLATLGHIVLEGVRGGSEISRKDKLSVAYTAPDPALVPMPMLGSELRLRVRLSRCRLTRRVVGGVLEERPATPCEGQAIGARRDEV
jgi:hypothetical protein